MPEQQNNPVSLGCGTLILIAVIVSIFSNANKDVEKEVKQLQRDVQQLTEEVRELREAMN